MHTMSFRANLYEQDNDKDRQHRNPFVNRLRTHTDGELGINHTSFTNFNLSNADASSRRNRSSANHHMAGEVMSGHTNAFPISTIYNDDKNTSPLTRSFRKLRSSTWDAGHGNLSHSLRLSPRMISGMGSDVFDGVDLEDGKPSQVDGQETDDVVSFSSSSENSEELEDRAAMADVVIPMLDEENDVLEGTHSSLYCDENASTPVKSNLSLEVSEIRPTDNLNSEYSGLNITSARISSLRRDKSSSADDGVKRSVTFSNTVGVQQFSDLDKVEESEMDVLNQSPNDSDSSTYIPEIRPQQYQERASSEQYSSLPRTTMHYSFLDYFNPLKNLSWSLVGSYIVRYAPCFVCVKKLGVSATDRNVLMRLNVLCAFHAVVQIALGLFLFVVTFIGVKRTNLYYATETFDKSVYPTMSDTATVQNSVSPDLWNLMLFVWVLSVVGLVLLIASSFAQRAIRNVNLVRSVRFMWTLFWLLPIQIFLTIGLFDYYRVMDVYTKHWWAEPGMAWYRSKFCVEDTAMTKCIVPIDGGEDYYSEEDWCLANYNALDCRSIRDSAQTLFEGFSYVFFTANGVWGLLLVTLMYVTLSVLQGIISLPIVQRSKESNIPLWLTFPVAGCFLIGVILLYGPSTVSTTFQDLYMIGIAYLVTGGTFALAAFMGIILKLYTVLNQRQKKFKQALVVIFIVTIVLTIFSVTTIMATSIIYSLNIIKIPTNAYHQIACMLDTGDSCTGCESNNPEEVCPEWSEGDVSRVLQTIMKQSATVAAIFLVYALTTLRYGFLLLRHVSSYQIDYV